jgi:hypothetical protein
VSVRRAQDERIEGTPDGNTAISEIMDVPDAPTIGAATNVGTSRAYNDGSATVAFTPVATGGTPTSYTATSTPGSFTGTGASSPITVTGLQSATAYTFAVSSTNANGSSPASSSSGSITATTIPQAPTVGTVTVSSTTASVPFTTGASGGSSVTTYTATSSPGSLSSSSATSPISVSGLTAGTAYTFTVTATNANGTSAASSASNSITPPIPYWINSVKDANNDYNGNLISTAVDSSGNVYAVGYGQNASAVVALPLIKYSSSGSIVWQRELTQPYNGRYYGVTVDSSGNVYACGQQVDGNGNYDGLVVKYNSSGTLQWQTMVYNSSTTSGSRNESFNSIAVDSSGNSYVVTTYFRAVAGVSPKILIVKLDSSGNISWQRTLSGTYSSDPAIYAGGLCLDSSANVYIAGNTKDSSGILTGYIAKYNSSGTIQWQRKVSDNGPTNYSATQCGGVTSDGTNIYVSATYHNSSGGVNAGILKYNASGAIQWQRRLADTAFAAASQYDSGGGISANSSGDVCIIGNYTNSGYSTDTFVAKYNTSGTIQWAKAFTDGRPSGQHNLNAYGVAMDSTGTVYYVGTAQYTSAANNFGYIAKLPADGTHTGTYSPATGQSIVYYNATLTDAAGGMNDGSASYTDASASTTATTGSGTSQTGSMTSNYVQV